MHITQKDMVVFRQIITTKDTDYPKRKINDMSRSGLLILSELERNVLQVSLDHMEEHLGAISSYVDVTDRLKACKDLKKAIL
jgi:hypothetical protein